jgi:hypothetical protein
MAYASLAALNRQQTRLRGFAAVEEFAELVDSRWFDAD